MCYNLSKKEVTLNRIGVNSHSNTTITIVVFDASFGDFFPTNTIYWFYLLQSLKSIEGLEHLNTSQVTDMSSMFSGCSSLTSLDLSDFDTSNMKDMKGMFEGCSSLTALDLSSFDTSKVTDMSELFTSCRQLKCIAWGKFQLQEEVNLIEVFSNCPSLTQITCHPNSEFNDLKRLFEHCALLKNAIDYQQLCLLLQNKAGNIKIPFPTPLPPALEAYVVQSADKTTLTFYYDKQHFSHPTPSWSVYDCNSNVPIWQHTSATTLKVIFSASFQNFRPTSTAYWFYDFKSLKSIEGLEYLNTSQVTDMNWMFSDCSSLTSLDLSSFDTSKVTDMSWMFWGCKSLTLQR